MNAVNHCQYCKAAFYVRSMVKHALMYIAGHIDVYMGGFCSSAMHWLHGYRSMTHAQAASMTCALEATNNSAAVSFTGRTAGDPYQTNSTMLLLLLLKCCMRLSSRPEALVAR